MTPKLVGVQWRAVKTGDVVGERFVIDRLEDGRIARSLHESVRFVPLESGVD